jgi:hypothetical protein
MKILKTALIIDGLIESMDTIEHEGAFWLVPEWLDFPARGISMPRRIVSLATLRHERMNGNPDFVVSDQVPRFVFDGEVPSQLKHMYIVRDLPEIRLPTPDKKTH